MFWSQEPMTHRLLLGVNFGRWIFWGIIEGPKDFSFLIFSPIQSSLSLGIRSNPPPLLPGMQRGYNIYSHTSSIRTSALKDTADWLIEHRKLTLPLEGVIFFFLKLAKKITF